MAGSHVAATKYGFNIALAGLFIGVPLTIGCILGAASVGRVSDPIPTLYAKRHHPYHGFCIQESRPWVQPSVCRAASGFGTQVATTLVYIYCTDIYKRQ